MTADVEDEVHRRPGDRAGWMRTAASSINSVSPAATATSSSRSTGDRVDYMDISPRMMVSIATAMIPFLRTTTRTVP